MTFFRTYILKKKHFLFITAILFNLNLFSQNWIEKNEEQSYTARHECSFVQAGDKFILFGGRESAQTLDVYDYAMNVVLFRLVINSYSLVDANLHKL